MLTITITLWQLLLILLMPSIIYIILYKIDKHKWNNGICRKCNNGNYKYLRWNERILSLSSLSQSHEYKCECCNNKIKIHMLFDKRITKNYIVVDTIEYKKFIRKQKLKKINENR